MSRLVAYMGSDPERLKGVLANQRDVLDVPAMPVEQADTVASIGIAFYQGGEILLQRRPRLGRDQLSLVDLLGELRTDTFLAQVQVGVPGKLAKNDNTPPYRFRAWTMAAHGVPQHEGVEALRDEISRQLPDFLRRNIRGQMFAEHLFHSFLHSLHEAGRGHIEDANLPPEIALAALRQALARLDEGAARMPEVRLDTLHIALTNGRCLVMLRRGGEPMWLWRLGGGPRQEGNEHLRGVLVYSGPGPSPGKSGAEEILAQQAVLVGRDLEPRLATL